MAKHRYKSIDGAVRRINQMKRIIQQQNTILDRWSEERQLLAKLAADTPQFYNPIHVIEAKKIRDRILNP